MTNKWNSHEFEQISTADELRIASHRADGTLRPYVIIWVVRVDNNIYVRSAHGTNNPWFVRATRIGTGRIQAGGVESDVTFSLVEESDAATQSAIDAAFHSKYDHYGQQFVGPVTSAESHSATLLLAPA